MNNRIVFSRLYDPAQNLALEEHLYDTQQGGACFYLWQNQNTVVVGNAQNAWKECRVALLESEGGRLVRRPSGGGAVFHDLGNLNFTFILPKADYDLVRQLRVVRSAAAAFGVETELSGRNDLVLTGTNGKFSGNAFRHGAKNSLHHGTLLVSADMDRLSRYLAPSPLKLAAKGVDSVRARVVNLGDICPAVTVPALAEALCAAFEREYGPARREEREELDALALARLTEKYNSWDWTYGKTPRFDATLAARLSFGCVELLLSLSKGLITQAAVYTDAMDETLAARLEHALPGVPFAPEALASRAAALGGAEGEALAAWLRQGF